VKPDGLIFYVHRRRPDSRGRTGYALADRILAGYPIRTEILWDKSGPGPGFASQGPGRPACYPTPAYETVFLLAQPGAGFDRGIAAQGDIWRIPRERVAGHPATFPVALAARCIASLCVDGPVLDPFCGSGSTLLAARAAGRDADGLDISAASIALAERRLAGQQLPLGEQ